MTAVIFAILSSITFGSADFLGGLATRRAALIAVMLGSQAAAFLTLLLAAAIVTPFWLPPHDLALSILAGISTSISIPMLYKGLAIGPMSIVAPVTALVAMLLPVLYGMAILGEAPPGLTLLGFALAGFAVFLLGGGEKLFESLRPAAVRQATPLRAFAYALGAGSCIALFYVATRSCSTESGLWPLVGARFVALIAMAGLALIRRRDQPLAWPGALLLVFILLSGALDGAGNAFYIVAAHGGDLGVVATITSLYPATTILLARYALSERISLAQTIGVVSALAAIVAIIWGLQVPA
jgi:uncharacterized membrane protein